METHTGKKPAETEAAALTEKVKLALLAMQRNSWEQGVAAQAFLESGDTDLALLMAKEAVTRQDDRGRLGVMYGDDGVTDPAANGEAVLYAAALTGEAQFRQAAERMLRFLRERAPRTPSGVLYHVLSRPQVWVDACYMAPPFLALAGHPGEAMQQIEGFRELLWDPQARLFSHIWDEGNRTFQRKAHWGVGNGWAAAGMARVLRALPASMRAEQARLAGSIRETIDGCLAHQRPDGLFHDVVDRPETFVETNLAQMLAYTIYRGVQAGWLEPAYRALAERMRTAVHRKVDRYGLVQGVCGAPHFDHPGTAPEGQAFFLLMEAAAAGREAPRPGAPSSQTD
jgi:unsaturated rhamnogalacturonyl hydrolase